MSRYDEYQLPLLSSVVFIIFSYEVGLSGINSSG